MNHPPFALLLDMDGVLYRGDQAIPSARTFLQRAAATPKIFLTNNSAVTPEALATRLQRLGLGVPTDAEILTSALATAHYLHQRQPGFGYFAVGGEGLQQALVTLGRPSSKDADFVVVGEGPGLDYASLTTGIQLILQRGARLIATNPDPNLDGQFRGQAAILPGGGALVTPFATATGQTPVVVGKPEPILYQQAMARLGMPAARCCMVGDRPDTDILGAARLGLVTILVRTGRFAPGEPYPPGLPRADFDVDDLADLELEAVAQYVRSRG